MESESESTTLQITEISLNENERGYTKLTSKTHLKSLIDSKVGDTLADRLISDQPIDVLKNIMLKEVSNSLFVNGGSMKKLTAELLVKLMTISTSSDAYYVEPKTLKSRDLGDNLLLVKNKKTAVVISVSETPVDYGHLHTCVAEMRKSWRLPGRKIRFVFVANIPADNAAGRAYQYEQQQSLIFEAVQVSHTASDPNWRDDLSESLFRLVTSFGPRDRLEKDDLVAVPTPNFQLADMFDDRTHLTGPELDMLIHNTVELGGKVLDPEDSEILALYCQRYLTSQLLRIEASPEDPTLLRIKMALVHDPANSDAAEQAEVYLRKIQLLDRDPDAKRQRLEESRKEGGSSVEEEEVSKLLQFFRIDDDRFKYTSTSCPY